MHLVSVFVVVVDARGFAGAARKPDISPPAVTRAINEMESQLGVRLLTRTTRVLRVTEPGARYADDRRRILVHREGRHASRKARAFLDLAIARLRANPALN